jgi:hypothetical protein
MTWTTSRPEVVLPAHEKGEVAIRPEFELPGDRWQKWLLASLGFGVMLCLRDGYDGAVAITAGNERLIRRPKYFEGRAT